MNNEPVDFEAALAKKERAQATLAQAWQKRAEHYKYQTLDHTKYVELQAAREELLRCIRELNLLNH